MKKQARTILPFVHAPGKFFFNLFFIFLIEGDTNIVSRILLSDHSVVLWEPWDRRLLPEPFL